MTDAPIEVVWVLCVLTFMSFVACSYAAADFSKTKAQVAIKLGMAAAWIAVFVRLFIPLVSGVDPTVSWFGVLAYSSISVLTIIEITLNALYRLRKYGHWYGRY